MKPTIENLKDTFKVSYDSFIDSRKEAELVVDLYHNRHYTDEQLDILSQRGQPKETFNIIKMFGRMLLGYLSTLANTIKVKPAKQDSIITAAVLQDTVNYIFRSNNMMSEGDKIKLDGLLTGLMCSYCDVVEIPGERDEFGRPKYEINITHIPSQEVCLDPMSRKDDYSDARFIHRFKWVDKESVEALFGSKALEDLQSYYNHLKIDEAEFANIYNTQFTGYYKKFDNYLIVHSIIKDGDKTWSVYWSNETILSKKEVTYKDVKNPYRVQKLNSSNRTEYYGVFREVIESQFAINQALLKIQLMANTQKAFVQDRAVDNLAEFTKQFNRVNAVIPVKDLSGVKIENLTREVLDQYTIIDKALDRVQRVLGINDSFLGMAFASDSGAKVKLQQNASVVAQRYNTNKIEHFYRLLGWDVVNLVKQYFTAHDIIRVSDNYQGDKWVELNKPLQVPTGRIDPKTGQPQMKMIFEEVKDPETGKPITDENGAYILAPIPTLDTDVAFAKTDIEIEVIAYEDNDNQKNQQILEQFINSPLGQMLAQVNPAGYLKAGSLSVKNVKFKYSPELAEILDNTAAMIQQAQQAQAQQQALQQQQEVQQQMLPNNKQGVNNGQ